MDARVCVRSMCVRLESSVEPEDRDVLPGPRYGGLLAAGNHTLDAGDGGDRG